LASLEPIDAHTHISTNAPAFLAMLEGLHMHVMDILYVDDTSPYRTSLEQQRQDALKFIASSHGLAKLCTTFDPFQLHDADFAQKAVAALNDDFANGAVGFKVWKNIGMEVKLSGTQYLMPDAPVLTPIYRDASAHNKTLIIHAADPNGAWSSRFPGGQGAKYYAAHPEWNMSKIAGAPSKEAILESRDHLLESNPDLRVIGAHLGSDEDHLDELARRLDRFPNLAVDTAARIVNLTLQPRETVRAFLIKYQDRVLYGSDLSFSAADRSEETSRSWMRQYLLDWRYFSSDDKFSYWGRQVEGLALPPSVLKKIYHDNAVVWLPGIGGGPNEFPGPASRHAP
jgi:predicted TIM-barrel fold metal-dependent hydrolase